MNLCSLPPDALPRRLAELRTRLGAHLLDRRDRDDGVVLTLPRRPDVMRLLGDVIADELACCPLVAWTIVTEPTHLAVTITGPPGTRALLAEALPPNTDG